MLSRVGILIPIILGSLNAIMTREYVMEEISTPEGVLVIDETGFLEKGQHSVEAKRQYSGTAGRIENCQIGVFLSYASGKGHALIDREVYLPKEWAADVARRTTAKVPSTVEFATKPDLARHMLERAFAAFVPCAWVTGDSIYGGDRRLRLWLEQERHWFVLGIAKMKRCGVNTNKNGPMNGRLPFLTMHGRA